MGMNRLTSACRLGTAWMTTTVALAADLEPALRDQALEGLRRGIAFFQKDVSVHGTFLWQYSEDLSKREGEGKASPTQGWVQPPGTPSVGMAFLKACEVTRDATFLEAVRMTAHGLVRGQLVSGGWTYSIEFDPAARRRFAYRDGDKKNARNVTTLDDDTTQAAVRFLLRADRALRFEDPAIHEAVRYALNSLLEAQYPNGAWPQGYEGTPDPEKFPVRSASFPEAWSRTWPGAGQYWRLYTLNDNVLANMVESLLDAATLCDEPAAPDDLKPFAFRCRAAAMKAGDFLLLAQLPGPQPAWAQQYDVAMHPAWARKFEPPAISGGESQGALETLLRLYRETSQAKYLEPIPRVLDYLRRSRLPDGRLARFYELRSNKPLYFTKDYQLTYDDSDMPTHYAFKVPDRSEIIAREFERLRQLKPENLKSSPSTRSRSVDRGLIAQVQAVLASQDARGRWIEDGRLRYQGSEDSTTRVIRSATFVRNIETLCRFLEPGP